MYRKLVSREKIKRCGLILCCIILFSPLILADQPAPAAITEAAEAATADPRNPQLQIDLGHACFEADLYERSLSAFRTASELAPRNLEAIINTGVVLNSLDRPQEALTYFKHALSIDPKNPNAMCNEAQAYYAIGDVAMTVSILQNVINIDNNSQIAHFYLGVCFVEAGIYKEALREWEQVVAIDADSEAGKQAAKNIDRVTRLITGD
jgi:cytochrome c-type biogenesis protein CcmH/NrfG